MGFRRRLETRILDLAMRQMNDLRPESVGAAEGEVLEIGFGTGLNLRYYSPQVKSVTGIDPSLEEAMPFVDERIGDCGFPVERRALRADDTLPFDAGRFDSVVTTWTLCTIPDPMAALAEMRRVLKPGGLYFFVEHGRSPDADTARWQDRLNPVWKRVAMGCNMNRSIDSIVERAGFEVTSMERFRNEGPSVLAAMYRGVARNAG
jgi:SAM-dependent methyltransferase